LHVALVEVDRETGRVAVRRYVVVEDCGRVVNPTIVEGQVHGAVAQGLGEALLEAIVYDGRRQLLTGTLMDYALPRADEVPAFEIGHMESPRRHAGRREGDGRGGHDRRAGGPRQRGGRRACAARASGSSRCPSAQS
jgi:carbon-monoxide dehydrogenase large subunit